MRMLSKCFYAAATVSCLIGASSAQEINPLAPLTAGGLTIGGPGAVVTQSGDQFFFWASTTPRDICVTVVNFGTVAVGVTLSSAQFTPANVGRTIAVCAPNTTNVTATCGKETGGLCRYLWRVDKAD
jgi:hypothetical protein